MSQNYLWTILNGKHTSKFDESFIKYNNDDSDKEYISLKLMLNSLSNYNIYTIIYYFHLKE